MRRIITAASLALTCLCYVASCGSQDRTVQLRYMYEPGEQFEYRQDGTRHLRALEGDSLIQEHNSTTTTLIRQVVRRQLEDSTAEIIEKADWEIIVPNKEDTTKLDTLHDSRETLVYLTPRGELVDVEFLSKTDSAERAYLREYYKQGYMVFPQEPVYTGYSWVQSTNVSLADTTAIAATKFVVQEFGREKGYDIIKIAYDGNLIIPIQALPDDTLQRSGLDRIHMQGILSFAPKEGLCVDMQEKWALDGERRRMKDGVMAEFRYLIDVDVDYYLVNVTQPK